MKQRHLFQPLKENIANQHIELHLKKRLNFNISVSEFNDLEKICNEFNITKTDFLRLMIKNTIENL